VTLLLAFLYPLAIQSDRGIWWEIALTLALILPITLLLDICANYTELALLTWDFPHQGEYTFSKRLERLQYTAPRYAKLASILNTISPSGKHIKS
jgi:hypothetical protein